MSCSTESLIPAWVTISVGSLMFIFLFATSIYSYTLLKHTSGWKDKGCVGKMKCWAADIWGRKSCYIPIISHLADTTTDFAAVAEFYIIANETTKQMCGELNVWYLFGLSVSCMMIYRIISSYVIYTLTRSWLRVLTQFIDIELFRILYVSHKYKLSKSSSPQRLISTLEAVFEAAPQALIQFIFLMKTDGLSEIIMLSVILSLFNLTSSAVSDDKMLKGFTRDFMGPFGWKKKLKTVSLLYLFRFCDIASQILCLCLFWVVINGYALTVIICIDFVIILIFYWRTNKSTDALMGLVAMPLSFGEEVESMTNLFFFWFYRLLWVISVNITLWIYFPSYISSDHQSVFVVALWCFASFGSIMKFPLLIAFKKFIGNEWYKTSKERANMPALCEKELFEDVIELMFYIHSSPKSSDVIMSIDNKPYATLLWVIYKACDARNDLALFNTMFEKTGLDLCDKDLCDTALHAVCSFGKLDGEEKCILAEKLLKQSTVKYLKALNHNGESLFMLMARSRQDEKELTICDLIWNKFNELSFNHDVDKEIGDEDIDEKEVETRTRLVDNTDDTMIEYLNTVIPTGTDWYTGWHALQFAVQGNGHHFFKKCLSLYPTKQSKRDILFRTDYPEPRTLLIGCVRNYNEECFHALWKEMNDFCAEMNNGDEFKTKYLNVQSEDLKEHALMVALTKPDMSSWGMSVGRRNVSDWFFRILDLYPNFQSKRDALQMKNWAEKDALQLCDENNWNKQDKEKTLNKINSILNGEEQTESIRNDISNHIHTFMQHGFHTTDTIQAMVYLNKLNNRITETDERNNVDDVVIGIQDTSTE